MNSEIRRTRIVATLGPATDAPGMLERTLRAGVDVVRLNLSHGSPEDQAAAEYRRRNGVGEVEQVIVEGGEATK